MSESMSHQGHPDDRPYRKDKHEAVARYLAEAYLCPVCRGWGERFGACGAHGDAEAIARGVLDDPEAKP